MPPSQGEQRRECVILAGDLGRFSQQGTPKLGRASFTGVRTEQSVHSICSFSCWCDKISNKSYLRAERFILAHDSRVWSITTGNPWWQELEAAGHIASTVEAVGHEHWCSAHSSSLYNP